MKRGFHSRMESSLKPLGRLVRSRMAGRKLPVFTVTANSIIPRQVRIVTLGDAIDYGYGVLATCGCKRTVHQLRAAAFLNLKNPPPESTPIRELAAYLVCEKCGEKADIRTEPTSVHVGGILPRKGFLQAGYYVPYVPYVPAPALDEPRPSGRAPEPIRRRRSR